MYGPYIKWGKNNYKIPKGGKDATDLTLEDCVAIIGGSTKQKTENWKPETGKKSSGISDNPQKSSVKKAPAKKTTVKKSTTKKK